MQLCEALISKDFLGIDSNAQFELLEENNHPNIYAKAISNEVIDF